MSDELIKADKISYINDVLNFLISTQERHAQLFNQKPPSAMHEVKIETDSTKIVILFVADVHMGSVFTDYRSLKDAWEFLIETPNLFLCVVGDFIDNFASPAPPRLLQAGIDSQLVSPDVQRNLYKAFLQVLQEKKKILAVVLGNHEDFSSLSVWFDGELKFPIARNRLYLKLLVNDQEYRIALIHKPRFNSYLNPLHGPLRELHLNYPDADVVVCSHTHSPAAMKVLYPFDGVLTERFLLRTGTLKNDIYNYSFYSPAGATTDVETALPSLLFSSTKKKIAYFSFFDAIDAIL